MMNLKKISKNSNTIFISFSILIYLIFILGWYYKPPWLIDHLIYVHIATAQNLADLAFWNFHRPELPFGHHNERWAIIVPIIIFDKIFFFLNPGLASQALIITIHIGIMISIYVILLNYNDRNTANIFLILWLFASHHTKNRATEILAEPFAILYVCLAVIGFIFFEKKKNNFFFFISASCLVLIPLVKIHLGIFSLILFVIYFNIIKQNFRKFVLFILITLIILNVILLINYGLELYISVIKNSFKVYYVYFVSGLPVGKGPSPGGWVSVWLKSIISENTLMPIFFLSTILLFFRKYDQKFIFSWFFVAFLVVIFILSAFSNFPANHSYAKPLHFFSIACLAIFLSEFLKPKNNSLNFLLILSSTTLPLLLIYYLGKYQNDNIIYSYYALTIIFSFVFIPYIYFRKIFFSFYILMFFLSINIFWNNWKNLSNHYSWRNGYAEHYKFLYGAADLIKNYDKENVAVNFSTWPINKRLLRRERMYTEPGLRSLLRNQVVISSYIKDDKIEIVGKKYEYLISDKKFFEFKKINEVNINSRFSGRLYLYKVN